MLFTKTAYLWLLVALLGLVIIIFWISLLITGSVRDTTISDKQPNILFIMVDDLGWGDVSWHDARMQTPVMESLARSGVLLNQSYVNMQCSPLVQECAFFTGYDPYHIGLHRDVFWGGEPTGVPLNLSFFTQELQKLNYTNYMVGKWHLGYCKKEYLPTYRGFDYFTGFMKGGGDYYSPSRFTLKNGTKETVSGYDFWTHDQVDYNHVGEYSTELFASKASQYLIQHKKRNMTNPFFLYLSFQATHRPLQAPEKYQRFCKQNTTDRRTYCAMTKAVDDAIGEVLDQLKVLDLYEDTLIVLQSDNGGDVTAGASNYPLRGNKATLWEGGTRSITFVHSPKLLEGITGVRSDLFFVTDWYPTLLSLAGPRIDTFGDGMNQWPMITDVPSAKKRQYFVYNIDLKTNSSAIRYKNHKLFLPTNISTRRQFHLTKVGDMDGWYNPNAKRQMKKAPIEQNSIQLFDVIADPTEEHDLFDESPDVAESMMHLLHQFESGAVPSIHKPQAQAGNPKHFNDTFSYGFC